MKNVWMKNFILENSDWVRRYMLESYPVPLDIIDRNADSIDWEILSRNDKIEYSYEFCEKYEERIDWRHFQPVNSRLYAGPGRDRRLIRFLDRFKDKLNWDLIQDFFRIPEDGEALLERYADYWDWNNLPFREWVPWNLSMLRKFRDLICWDSISINSRIPWKFEWVKEFEDRFDWYWFYYYGNFRWSYLAIVHFSHHLKEVGIYINEADAESIPGIDEDNSEGNYSDCAMEYEDDAVNSEEIELADKPITMLEVMFELEEYKRKGTVYKDFQFCSFDNQTMAYLLEQDNVDKSMLISNALPTRPSEFYRKYRNRLEWGRYELATRPDEDGKETIIDIEYTGVSANTCLVWTEELLDEFRDYLNWDILASIGRFVWTPGILKKYFHKMPREALIKNDGLFHKLIVPEMNDIMWDIVLGSEWS